MRITGIATTVRARYAALVIVLVLVLSLLSGWNARAIAAPNAALNATNIQAVSSNQTTHQTPGIAATGLDSAHLYIAWAGDNTGHHIFVTTADSLNSSVQLSDTVLSGTGVGVCSFDNTPFIVFTGTNDQVYIGWYNGTYYLQAHTAVPGAISYQTPSCAADYTGSSVIRVAWTGTDKHLNMKETPDGAHFSTQTWTDTGDWANRGIGINDWITNSPLSNTSWILAFSGTDSRHLINWTDFASRHTDVNNWTNSDVEVTSCCNYTNDLYITWQAADSSEQIFYETWDPTNLSSPTPHRWIHQANAGIGVAAQGSCVYFAWGDLNGYLNVEQVTCV